MNSDIRGVAAGASIAVIGLGNIGSQVVPLLAGVSCVSKVILIDPDHYGAANLGHQRIAAAAVDRLKVKVQQRALRALAAHIAVDTSPCRIEAVPPARLHNCVMLACVDSRAARQSINRIAFRLGVPWIDAGLDRSGSVRARVYLSDTGDCLECNWGVRDYELLEQQVPCRGDTAALATVAPMELGSIAAGLQVMLLRRLLSRESAESRHELARQQWFLDLPSGRGWIGHYAGKNPHCRFDHLRWQLSPLPRSAGDITLGEAFALAGMETDDATFSVDGQMIVRRVRCAQCGAVRSVGGRILARIGSTACQQCSRAMTPAAIDASDRLRRKDISAVWLDRPLAAFGLADGDVITLNAGDATVHYELGYAKHGGH